MPCHDFRLRSGRNAGRALAMIWPTAKGYRRHCSDIQVAACKLARQRQTPHLWWVSGRQMTNPTEVSSDRLPTLRTLPSPRPSWTCRR